MQHKSDSIVQKKTDGMTVRTTVPVRRMVNPPEKDQISVAAKKPRDKRFVAWQEMLRTLSKQICIIVLCGLVVFGIIGYYAHRADITVSPVVRMIHFQIPTHFASRILSSGVHISYASQSYANQDEHFVQMAGYPHYLPLASGTGNTTMLGSRGDIDRIFRNYVSGTENLPYQYSITRYANMRTVFTGYDPGADRMIGFLSGDITIRAKPNTVQIRKSCTGVVASDLRRCLSETHGIQNAVITLYPAWLHTLPSEEGVVVRVAR